MNHLINDSYDFTLVEAGLLEGVCHLSNAVVDFEESVREQWNVVPYEGFPLTLSRAELLATPTTPQRTPSQSALLPSPGGLPSKSYGKETL